MFLSDTAHRRGRRQHRHLTHAPRGAAGPRPGIRHPRRNLATTREVLDRIDRDLAVYRNDRSVFDEHRIEADSKYLAELEDLFVRRLLDGLDDLPAIPWSAT